MKIAGMVALAALTGWFLRGIRSEHPHPSPAPIAAQPIAVQTEPTAPPPSLIQRVPLELTSTGNRNLFAYRVHDKPVIVQSPATVIPMPVVATPLAVVATAPEPIPFPWRYIGTFGTARNRVAAFKREGDIVTLRQGDRIGEFVLRSIGQESAEVTGPDGTRRIALATSMPQ